MKRVFQRTWLLWPVAVIVVGAIVFFTLGVHRKPAALPEEILDPPWLTSRRDSQLATVDRFDVFYNFQFTDRVRESGITFSHRVVQDAGRDYIAVHYDHGNGVAVADVDNDGLLDIYFCTQVGSNELWRNLGDGRFEDITMSAGVGAADRIGVTATFADTDNDGDADLFVTSVRGGNLFFENDGRGRFKDITNAAGLDYVGHSSAGVFFDYDRDGLLDLFLANVGVYTKDEKLPDGSYRGLPDAFSGQLKVKRTETSILYQNRGKNRFVDVTKEVGLIDDSWSGDASPLDANEDGWPDLYVLDMQGNDEYFENIGGRRFVKRSRELFSKTPWGSMGVKVFDFDNDGKMDIYITDMHSDMSELQKVAEEKQKSDMQWPESFLVSNGNSIFGNAFYANRGLGKYVEISDRIGAENYWPWGLSVGDLNADGFDDVFIASSMNYPFRYGVNSLLLNNRGKEFLDSEFILGVEPRRDRRTAKVWFEFDTSKHLPRGEMQRELERLSDLRGPKFEVWGALGSRSSVIFDLDDDGDLDIVTAEFNSEPMVLVSNLAQVADVHFLKLQLRGVESNRDGLGARVTVRTASAQYTKVVDGKSGYLSQSRMPLYFGLNSEDVVTQVEVVWPSGRRQVVNDPIKVNSLLEIEEESDSE